MEFFSDKNRVAIKFCVSHQNRNRNREHKIITPEARLFGNIKRRFRIYLRIAELHRTRCFRRGFSNGTSDSFRAHGKLFYPGKACTGKIIIITIETEKKKIVKPLSSELASRRNRTADGDLGQSKSFPVVGGRKKKNEYDAMAPAGSLLKVFFFYGIALT